MNLRLWSLAIGLGTSAFVGAAGGVFLLGWYLLVQTPEFGDHEVGEIVATHGTYSPLPYDPAHMPSTNGRQHDADGVPRMAMLGAPHARGGTPSPSRQGIRNATLVTIDHDDVARTEAGHRLAFDAPELAANLTVLVDDVRTSKWGTRSIRGHVAGDPTLGFVMTTSTRATYETVATEAGVFDVFGNTREAWIVATETGP